MRIAFPFPRREASVPRPRRYVRTIGAVVLLAALGTSGAWYWQQHASASQPAAAIPAPVIEGALAVTIEGSGSVAAGRTVGLPFQASGQVAEVLVTAGQHVTRGQPLARIDDRQLKLELQEAEAALQTARAKLQQASEGSATEQEITRAQADLDSARAQATQTSTGSAADIREAEAALRSAQAQLDALLHPSEAKTSAARLALAQAEEGLRGTQASSAAAKERAREATEQAANALRTAQDTLSKVTWDTRNGDGSWKLAPGDPGYEQAVERYTSAERAEQDAASKLRQAQIEYETARQQEQADIREAEARVDDARKQLDALLQPDANAITQARAAVEQAAARYEKLRSGSGAEAAQAQAQVTQAQAALEALTAPAAASAIAIAEADVAAAHARVDAAQLTLDNATLAAPFEGVIATVGVEPGAIASAGTEVLQIIDDTTMYLDLNVSETDIARVQVGQPASITFDALPDTTLSGRVESVAPAATEGQSAVSYRVRVSFAPGEAEVKIGMSASASITVEEHAGVIQVPTRTIQSRGQLKTIDVYTGAGDETATIQVETGATNGAMTEIVSCSEIGRQCLKAGDRVAVRLPGTSGGPATGGDMLIPAAGGGGAPGSRPAQRVFIQP